MTNTIKNIFLLAGTCMVAACTQVKDPVDIGNRRELFLDDLLVGQLKGDAQRVFHKPVPREIVFTADKPWEGGSLAYPTIFKDEGIYRMYYRGNWSSLVFTCYAESTDGVHWTRPNPGLVEFDGSMDNNILTQVSHPDRRHTLVVFRDENPYAAPDARYRAVSQRVSIRSREGKDLEVWKSPDGIRWTLLEERILRDEGGFDSQNLAFWDPNINAYRAYWRRSQPGIGRGIWTGVSSDFVNWESISQLGYTTRPSAQFYTNVIRPYHRAPHIYIGFPGMYDDRGRGTQEHLTPAAAQLPDFEKRLELQERWKRYTSLSEVHLMWSRNGLDFDLAPSAFITPGPERPASYTYSDHVAWHLVETESVFKGAAPELTLYKRERCHYDNEQLRRYTLRLDGFASIHAPIAGGELVTPPLVFKGSALSMNFATSAFGSLRVELQDASGTPIPGFTLDDSIELYGDTVARNAMWKDDPDLSALAGRSVRLRFVMRDADLYSIKFE